MGRSAKISRDRLQAAALALVDRDGLPGLSMRNLAAAVGTGAMTLYNHVAHREDLELLVVEAVLEQARWRRVAYADWRDEVRAIAIALWKALRAHPHVIPLIVTRRSRSPAVFDISEALLAALARGGRSGTQLLLAFRSLQALVMGFAQVELTSPLSRAAGERPQAVIGRFRALPPTRYPHLVEIATAAMRSRAEAEFRAGLDCLLDGLSSMPLPGAPSNLPRSRTCSRGRR